MTKTKKKKQKKKSRPVKGTNGASLKSATEYNLQLLGTGLSYASSKVCDDLSLLVTPG